MYIRQNISQSEIRRINRLEMNSFNLNSIFPSYFRRAIKPQIQQRIQFTSILLFKLLVWF